MRRFLIPIAVAGLLALPLRPAAAQTSINQLQQFGAATTVLYLPFSVSVAGNFTMRTSGVNLLDPMIRLYGGASFTGAGLGAFLFVNDDDATLAQPGWNICTGAGGTCHSAIIQFLAAGDYTLATSAWDLTDEAARAGGTGSEFNANGYPGYCVAGDDWSACNYNVALTSDEGVAATVTPEPASLILLGTGLAGVFARRRKKNAA